jgi:hypothetical protein
MFFTKASVSLHDPKGLHELVEQFMLPWLIGVPISLIIIKLLAL